MGRYVESNLNPGEKIVIEAKRTPLLLLGTWIKAILFFWVLFIPVISAIITTLRYSKEELGVTNKRVVGKKGLISRSTIDIPIAQVESAKVDQGFFARLFKYGTIEISTGDLDGVSLTGLVNADAFKRAVMNQVEEYKRERDREQAEQMAKAMAAAMEQNKQA